MPVHIISYSAQYNTDFAFVNSESLQPVGDRQMRGTVALQKLPWPYLRNLIACNLATKVVYAEGLAYADSMPTSQQELADIAFR